VLTFSGMTWTSAIYNHERLVNITHRTPTILLAAIQFVSAYVMLNEIRANQKA
jgi:hypothetical protein